MPVLKHAKKKLRQDKVRTARNKALKELFKKLVKEARAKKTQKAVDQAFSAIDKAAKHYILHKNTAGRMKSSLAKVLSGKSPAVKAVVEKTASTTAAAAKEVKKVAAVVEKTATKVAKKSASKKK